MVEHESRDLDDLAALSGRGEEDDVGRAILRQRRLVREQARAHAGQAGVGRRGGLADADGRPAREHRRDGGLCRLVARCRGDQHGGRRRGERGDEATLDPGLDRHVDEHHRQPAKGVDLAGRGSGGAQLEQHRAVRDAGGLQLCLEAPQQARDLAGRAARRRHAVSRERGPAQLGQGRGERRGEPGKA
jgi:hypothetical protein